MEGGVRANILCLPSILYSQADICCPLTKVFLGNLVVILGNRNQPPFIAHREEFRNYFCQCNGNGNGGLRPFRPPLHRCQFVGRSVGPLVVLLVCLAICGPKKCAPHSLLSNISGYVSTTSLSCKRHTKDIPQTSATF